VCETTPTGQTSPKAWALAVELAQKSAAVCLRGASLGIDANTPHSREIDHDPVVARRESRDTVAAAPNRRREVLLSREADGRYDVSGAAWPDDDCRTAVDHPVPNRTG